MKNLNSYKKEFLEVGKEIEGFHSLFRTMWELGYPQWDESIPTACVVFDPKQEFNALQFRFNPAFWDKLDNYSRAFVVCHECLHAFLLHGKRAKNLYEQKADNNLINGAMDLAINHMLVNCFGFEREKVAGWDKLWWVESAFPKDQISNALNFEEYYTLLVDEKERRKEEFKEMLRQMGIDPDGDPQAAKDALKKWLQDNKDQIQWAPGGEGGIPIPMDWAEELGLGKPSDEEGEGQGGGGSLWDELFDNQSPDEHTELPDDIQKALEYEKMTPTEKEDVQKAKQIMNGADAGNALNLIEVKAPSRRVKPSRAWEKLISRWKRIGMLSDDDSEQWVKPNRKMQDLPDNMILPSEQYLYDDNFGLCKLNLLCFLDYSGSCQSFRDHFIAAYKSIPERRFNKRAYLFGGNVSEFNAKTGEAVGDVNDGSTSFHAVNQAVRDYIKNTGQTPDIIWVITDGCASHDKYKASKKWHWFLYNDGIMNAEENGIKKGTPEWELHEYQRKRYAESIPKDQGMEIHDLEDFFKITFE